MSISQLARSIKESPTLKLNEEAQTLRARGEAVINMGVGEPKNKAPITAVLGSAAKLNDGDVKYVPVDGTKSLKKAIIRYTEENYGRLVGPDNVIISTGAKQSLFNLLFSIIDPQDEVIILAPYWVSYPEMVKMVHGVPVIVTPEEIEDAVSSYTKEIIVNSPNNPSGTLYSADFIAEIVNFCENRDIYLILDDIYHKLVFDGKQAPSPFNFTDKDIETTHLVVLNGVSKLYGMTGFRIGWAVGNSRLIEVMGNVQGQVTSNASTVSQAAAEAALTGPQNVVENLRLGIQNNRDVIMNELRSFTDVKVTKPDGTFYILPDFRAYTNNSVELAQFLLRKALVVAVPGREFGAEGHLRLSYSGSVKEIIEAVDRMKWALDPNAPNEIYIGDRKCIRDWM